MIKSLETLSDKTADAKVQEASKQLLFAVKKGSDIPFTDLQLKILREIFDENRADGKYARSKPSSAAPSPTSSAPKIAAELSDEFADDAVLINI